MTHTDDAIAAVIALVLMVGVNQVYWRQVKRHKREQRQGQSTNSSD